MQYLSVLGGCFEKLLLSQKSALVIFFIANFDWKEQQQQQKSLYFVSKRPDLGILRPGFYKTFVIFYIITPKFVLMQRFGAKIKILKFGIKKAWFGSSFWLEVKRKYCHIWNQRRLIFLIAKFGEKIKISQFGTKNALFGYF